MVKIVSRKILGKQPVYDIGVERSHNFILANGLVASNCFNKSHSTAYAYVTYQTAYLKANFTGEYMAALLTANSEDQEKVKKYIDSCKKMGIKVEPPDINRSGVEFTPLSENKILFGLLAVRNVGQEAIKCILEAREKGGEFKSLADMCDRVALQAVNSRALESLIKCGAFDSIDPNRQKLVAHLELVIKWAQNRAKDREIGQLNLFDVLGATKKDAAFESAPKPPDVADYPSKEKLLMEKELLGFYVSEHPLKAVQESAWLQKLKPISLSQIEDLRQGTKVVALVMLTEIKLVTTKKGDRMAILFLEDLEGNGEAVAFPQTYENIRELLVTDAPVILSGKVDKRDERTQLIVENIESIAAEQLAAEQVTPPPTTDDPELKHQETTVQEDSDNQQKQTVPMQTNEMVMVDLTPPQVKDPTQLEQLKALLKEYSGDFDKAKVPVFGMVGNQHLRKVVRFGQQYWVENKQGAVNALNHAGFTARIKPGC